MSELKVPGPAAKTRRLRTLDELLLALLPTVTVLLMFGLLEAFGRHHLLCASLASSAFLVYLDPEHQTNAVRTLIISQMSAAGVGWVLWLVLGPGYAALGGSMALSILLMILLDALHPPAISTALAFAMHTDENGFLLFGFAGLITAVLVLLQRAMLWLLRSKHD
jgi:CBS-domain-containing membrane protein